MSLLMFGSTKKLKEEKYDLNLFKWRSKLLKPQMLFFLTGIMVWFEAFKGLFFRV